MRPKTVKAVVIEDYNDKYNKNKLVEEGTRLELEYYRFEELKAKGKVKEDNIIIRKKEI